MVSLQQLVSSIMEADQSIRNQRRLAWVETNIYKLVSGSRFHMFMSRGFPRKVQKVSRVLFLSDSDIAITNRKFEC